MVLPPRCGMAAAPTPRSTHSGCPPSTSKLLFKQQQQLRQANGRSMHQPSGPARGAARRAAACDSPAAAPDERRWYRTDLPSARTWRRWPLRRAAAAPPGPRAGPGESSGGREQRGRGDASAHAARKLGGWGLFGGSNWRREAASGDSRSAIGRRRAEERVDKAALLAHWELAVPPGRCPPSKQLSALRLGLQTFTCIALNA